MKLIKITLHIFTFILEREIMYAFVFTLNQKNNIFTTQNIPIILITIKNKSLSYNLVKNV